MVWMNDERLHMSPVHKRMQMSVARVEPGLAVLSMPLTEDLRGYFEGSIHGGMLATFADAASASCLEGAYDFGSHFPVTTDIHVRYYRQPKSGPLIAKADLVHGGRRLLSTECSVVDAEDHVLIRTTATFMLVPNTSPYSAQPWPLCCGRVPKRRDSQPWRYGVMVYGVVAAVGVVVVALLTGSCPSEANDAIA